VHSSRTCTAYVIAESRRGVLFILWAGRWAQVLTLKEEK